MDGSLITMPSPRANTTVFAVPRSMARSAERARLSQALSLRCVLPPPGLTSQGPQTAGPSRRGLRPVDRLKPAPLHDRSRDFIGRTGSSGCATNRRTPDGPERRTGPGGPAFQRSPACLASRSSLVATEGSQWRRHRNRWRGCSRRREPHPHTRLHASRIENGHYSR